MGAAPSAEQLRLRDCVLLRADDSLLLEPGELFELFSEAVLLLDLEREGDIGRDLEALVPLATGLVCPLLGVDLVEDQLVLSGLVDDRRLGGCALLLGEVAGCMRVRHAPFLHTRICFARRVLQTRVEGSRGPKLGRLERLPAAHEEQISSDRIGREPSPERGRRKDVHGVAQENQHACEQ